MDKDLLAYRQWAKSQGINLGQGDPSFAGVRGPAVATPAAPTRNSSGIGSVAGGILGGIAGTALGPLGTIGGGAAGSALGEALDQLLTTGKLHAQDIGKEGAIGLAGGVAGKALGLGVKGVRAAQAVKLGSKGSALADAVAGASETTAKAAPNTGVVSNALTKAGDNLAVRGLRANSSQITNYAKTSGEDITKTLARHGLQGADIETIAKTIQPLQQAYDDMALNAGISIPKSTIQSKLAQKLAPFLKSGASDDQAMAQQLKDEVAGLLKSTKGSKVNLADLTNQRRRYDELTKSFANDPFGATKNRSVGTILREVVQEAADGAGLKDTAGRSLKETGRELQRLYAVQDIAGKQANLGRGTLPMGITSLLGGGIGGGVGGPGGGLAGALAGVAATKAVNNPRVIGAASKALTGAGERVASGSMPGANIAAKAMPALGVAGSQLGVRGAMAVATPPQTAPDAVQGVLPPQPPVDASSVPGSATAPQSSSLVDKNTINSLLQQALSAPDAKTQKEQLGLIGDLLAIQEKLNPASSAVKPYNSVTATTISDFQSSLRELGNLSDAISGGKGSVGPISGRLRSSNPYDTSERVLQAQIDKTRQLVGKALEGGVLRKEDEEKYKKILPTTLDTKEVALAKIQNLQAQLSAKLGDYQGLVGGGNTGLDELLANQ